MGRDGIGMLLLNPPFHPTLKLTFDVAVDNGYIQFTNVRIPRAYMLMKHTQVTREGKVFEPPLAQLTWVIMMHSPARGISKP
jgi:hypothetical protein